MGEDKPLDRRLLGQWVLSDVELCKVLEVLYILDVVEPLEVVIFEISYVQVRELLVDPPQRTDLSVLCRELAEVRNLGE